MRRSTAGGRYLRQSLHRPESVADEGLARQLNVTAVEIHTGAYADAKTQRDIEIQYDKLREAGQFTTAQGLRLNMGHD